jgi:hypothetical protein
VSEVTRPSELNSHRSVRNTLVFITGVRESIVNPELRRSGPYRRLRTPCRRLRTVRISLGPLEAALGLLF